MDAERLDEAAIAAGIAALRWTRDGDSLVTTRRFDGFAAAVGFVDRVALLAEARRHHPEITISYDRVGLRLTTHDVGGLSAADVDLAAAIDALDAELSGD
jgi:4a-hydroxytetrahydrobiopterin dehydratase